MYYRMKVAGLERDLPICPVTDTLYIAGFVIFGDQELTVACARELLKKAPAYDYIITAEAKGIPLAHEMARQADMKKYFIARVLHSRLMLHNPVLSSCMASASSNSMISLKPFFSVPSVIFTTLFIKCSNLFSRSAFLILSTPSNVSNSPLSKHTCLCSGVWLLMRDK